MPLTLTSCLSENTYPICQTLAAYLSDQLPFSVEFVTPEPWQQRADLLAKGQIHFGWICGLLYTLKKSEAQRSRGAREQGGREEYKAPPPPPTPYSPHPPTPLLPYSLLPLVAPAMAWPRYQNRPIYFSDVVVRRDSPFHTFASLRGARFAYNEPGSFSGYAIVRHHLATLGEMSGYFGQVIESGAHQQSLKMVLAGQVDAAAIDSMALDLAAQTQPELREQLRVVETLGPNPAPPWVISNQVAPPIRRKLQETLLALDASTEGRAILKQCHLSRFVAVEDRDYDQIRQVTQGGEQATL